MEILLGLFAAGVVAAGYFSLPAPQEKAVSAIAVTPPPQFDQSGYWAFSSDTIRFNEKKVPTSSIIGQFGLKEEFVPDGLGCMTRIGNVNIDKF